MNKEKKILITGATGFVGTNLTPYLQNFEYSTIGITRNPNSSEEIDYNHLNNEVWNKAFAMLHLAGKAHDLKGVSNENEYFEVNTEFTKQLFNQFLESECKVFIYMSSVKAAADTVVTTLTEDVEPTPATAYGKSKLAAEQYLFAQKLPADKKVYILRPCMIHGPGNRGNLNLLYQLVSKGIPWPLGAFENQRSFCSIDNLCFVIKELLVQKNISSGVYNVSDDLPLSTNELIKFIAIFQNKKVRILNVPKGFIKLLAKLGSLMHLPFNEERLQKLTENYLVSNKKIKNAIAKSLPVISKNGFLKTFKSFQNK